MATARSSSGGRRRGSSGGAAAGMGPEVIMPPEFGREIVLRCMRASDRGLERETALGSSCGSRRKVDERIRRSGRHLSTDCGIRFF
jgi:hypothetical protein